MYKITLHALTHQLPAWEHGDHHLWRWLMLAALLMALAVALWPAGSDPEAVALTVITEPSGAGIWLDSRYRGKSPLLLHDLEPGSASVTLRRRGYAEFEKSLQLRSGQREVLRHRLRPLGETAVVRVDSVPPGALWTLNGVDFGTTPGQATSIPSGSHLMEVTIEGFAPWRQILSLNAGETRDVVAHLERPSLHATYLLSIVTQSSDARVRLLHSGRPYRPGLRMHSGSYPIEIERAGYRSFRGVVHVDARDVRLTVSLEPLPTNQAVPREPDLIRVTGGCFNMGSPASEPGRDQDEAAHQVCVGDFSIGLYEVTFEEYDQFCESEGIPCPEDEDLGRDRQPVINVAWQDAQNYVEWLRELTGKPYRLPTEAEWEYAARAGTATSRFWGEDSFQACLYANVADQTAKQKYPGWDSHQCNDWRVGPAPVGTYWANPYGLHDMLGNVWEWTCSLYSRQYTGAETQCAMGDDNAQRAVRGGAWISVPDHARIAVRNGDRPIWRSNLLGFRVAMD